MKRIIIFISILLFAGSVYAGQGFPRHPNVKNTTLTSTAAIYSLTLPEGTGDINIQSRTAADFKIGTVSNLSDGVVYTVKSGSVLRATSLGIAANGPTQDTTIYLQGTASSQVIETLYWQ